VHTKAAVCLWNIGDRSGIAGEEVFLE